MKHSNLPHISLKGYCQFVTFRTKDSVDEYLKKIENSFDNNKVKQYKIDSYLDSSTKGAYLNGEVLDLLKEYIFSKDRELFNLIAFAIMPNHIHILFEEIKELSETMKLLKGGSSHKINKFLNQKGSFWSNDYYDKLIRDEKHFEVVYNYIKNNPIKAGLQDVKERFYGIYE